MDFNYVKYLLDQLSRTYYLRFKKDVPIVDYSVVKAFVEYALNQLSSIRDMLNESGSTDF